MSKIWEPNFEYVSVFVGVSHSARYIQKKKYIDDT
jgi:hypothetical protein